MKFEFKPEDFSGVWAYPDRLEKEAIAARANGILNDWLDKQTVVYGLSPDAVNWVTAKAKTDGDIYCGIVCCIEPIEPCKHLKMGNLDNHDHLSMISGGIPICPDCGARMKRIVTWEPVE